MEYIFVAYIYKCNSILMRPMKSRKDEHMVQVFEDIYSYLCDRNLSPSLHIMDNECLKAIHKFIKKEKMNIQLVELHNCRMNAAKPTVKAVKCHTISALATVHPTCPLRLWCKFDPQIQDTLIVMHTARRNSNISAYEDMEGAFDWNKTPLDPLGGKSVVYAELDERPLWRPHAGHTFYIGRAPLHYRLKIITCVIPTASHVLWEKIYPAHYRAPAISEVDLTISAAAELFKSTKGTVPGIATEKQRHTKILKKLLSIVENSKPWKVANAGQTRVSPAASTLTNATSPGVIASTRFVYQRRTRNNTTLPSI